MSGKKGKASRFWTELTELNGMENQKSLNPSPSVEFLLVPTLHFGTPSCLHVGIPRSFLFR